MDQPADMKDAVELAEAARRLGISLSTLRTIVEHGFLKAQRDDEGHWKVLLEPGDGVPPRPLPRTGGPKPMPGLWPAAASAPEPPPPSFPPAAAASAAGDALSGPPDAGEAQAPPPPPPASAAPALPVLPAVPAASIAPAVPAAPVAPVADIVERLLTEQIIYLRQQLERREHEAWSRDQLVGELANHLAKLSRRGLDRPVAESDLRQQIERVRAEQAEVSARHQRALDGLGDLLLSLRNHLAGQQGGQRQAR